MPNGEVHSGKTHGATSKKLFHLDELSKTAKEKAMKYSSGYGKKKQLLRRKRKRLRSNG